ncbi:putative transcription factor TDA9 [Madurella mycetomatis]|uniref:Transcription factor TDA9 n=1 Tax=Madurella mycetomatis TaxID=100816 RepID=A0A175VZ98_9PEZI|nr:putative transcription factor TDA9 [Madurella mycetomatis]
MASLKFIMDVNDDRQTADGLPPHNKRDKGASKPASTGQLQEPPDLATEQDINQAAPAAQPKRRGAPSRGPKSTAAISGRGTGAGIGAGPAATISSSSSSPPSSLSAPTTRPSARRQSTTSNDSMDLTRYGSMVSSSSASGGPQRPVRIHPGPAQLPPRITPKTGRVSKAQKGLPVHVCNICNPPKTFTRAEHLRRHQLSHGDPRFPCTNCERVFHRADLLARHQQKQYQSPRSPSALVAGSGPGPASSSATEIPPAPSAGTSNQTTFSQVHGNSVYTIPENDTFKVSPDHTIINPTRPSPLNRRYPGGPGAYQPPKSGHLYVVTRDIPQPSPQPADQPPDLQDTSSWPSSASDSPYSTPSDVSRNPRHWIRGHRSPTGDWSASQRLSPYPPPGSRGLQTLLAGSYTSNAQPQEQHFGGAMLGMPSLGFPGAAGHHSSLSGSSDSTFRTHHVRQHGNSTSSIRSQTPPLSMATHAGDPLIAPIPIVPSRLDPLDGLDRRKGMMVDADQDLMGQGAISGMNLLGGLDIGYGGSGSANAVSPGGDNSNHSNGIVAGLDLAMVGGCAIPGPAAMAIPLPGPVRAAIPGYLKVYWARVDPLLPLVHRQSFEAAPEEVLKCAMAALATQHLDNREDRARGNQLHEYAWQELKRIPQWSLQVMQAILLCEYFARFRGRKAVTRPSKPFESLYSRVSALWSSTVPPSSAPSEDSGFWLVDTTTWSPVSSPNSSASSFDSITPTTTTMSPYALRHLSPHPSTPWGSFSSSYTSSATSPFGNTSLSSSDPSLAFEFPSSLGSNLNFNLASPSDARSRAQTSRSSHFFPDSRNPVPAPGPPLFLSTFSQAPGQAYLQSVSNAQVLYHNPALLDNTMLAADQQTPTQDRWRSWVDAESRRRLLAACVFCDGHAAIYQQQRRVQDVEAGASAALPLVPLLGRSTKLWEASSAEEWASTLDADPSAADPDFVPPIEQLTPEDIQARPPFDQMIILGVCALRLPRRQRLSGASVSAANSPASELDPHTQHVGSQFGPDQQPNFLRQISETQDAPYFDAEERINTLFRHCPVANTYLALHHTPLRDLLAVGGDSWLFTQKVLPATSFAEHQRRLKLWVKGLADLSAARATVYAARAILGFLERQPAPWSADLADYWALYVCALICWAFSHRMAGNAPSSSSSSNPVESQQQQQQQQSQQSRQRSSSGGSSPASGASGVVFGAGAATDDETIGWLRMMAAEGMRLEGVGRVYGRREASGVVGLVRRRLESDCVGGRSRLYVDAVGVLRKIEDGVGTKWY